MFVGKQYLSLETLQSFYPSAHYLAETLLSTQILFAVCFLPKHLQHQKSLSSCSDPPTPARKDAAASVAARCFHRVGCTVERDFFQCLVTVCSCPGSDVPTEVMEDAEHPMG